MSNSYFQFKQFTVQQDRCAMKVSTDACIQGAWAPITEHVQHVLDIGAGTGLLSLMLAQRNEQVLVDAIELDIEAAKQASENINNSPWRDRINVIQADARNYAYSKQYDMIICNPPFFQNSLKGDEAVRNMARHNDNFTYADLLDVIKHNLNPNGYACILLPYAEHGIWESLLAKNDWAVTNRLTVRHRDGATPTRVFSVCTTVAELQIKEQDLLIKDSVDNYSQEFTGLLKDFYLHL